nr:saccharopine dehydrogenase NADP-binding domain-containing protein [Oscillospiraceae bacterium]
MKLLVIGCGGVATVAIHKCCQNPVFTEICIASRTVSKCEALAEKLAPTTKAKLSTATVDADSLESLVNLMKEFQPHTVLNVALPYQDLT